MEQVKSFWAKYMNVLAPIRNTKKSVLALIAMPILTLSTIGIVHAVTTNNAGNRAIVMFIGDSNTSFGGAAPVKDLTYGEIAGTPDHKDNNYIPVFVARAGAGIRTPDCLTTTTCTTRDFWKIKLANTFLKIKPDAFVTELGINDAALTGSSTGMGTAGYAQKIDWFMSLLPTNKPVFWTNLACNVEPAPFRSNCNFINNSLVAAQTRWPNLHVLNWALVANSHPEYMAPLGPFAAVHYTEDGYGAWTRLVMNALDVRFPQL